MGLTRFEALQILGLEEGCTEKEIRERFKKLALKWHPDKNFHNPDEAQKKFQVISAAYSRLLSKEEDDVRITLGDIFNDFHRYYNPHAHVFCDCDICRDEWGGMDFADIIGSDSDLYSDEDDDDDGLYSYDADDKYYADQLLRAFAERLYRNFNGPSRMARKAREDAWEASVYKRKNISAEEASRNADELLKAEEKEKREAEKRRQKNKKKRDAKKKKKAKMQQGLKSAGTNKSKSSEGIKKVSSVQVEVSKEEGASGHVDEERGTDTDDDEIDISSAFVARASKKNCQQSSQSGTAAGEGTSNSVKNKGTFTHKTDDGKENVDPGHRGKMNGTSAGPADVSTSAETMARSRQLAGLGNIAAKDGHFSEAVRRFTEAIDLYPFDHRYFGNRSFCFDYLQEYTRALEDANAALQLDSSWPKGYYRQGRAYTGLKRLDEAEESYVKALQLDPNYKDAEEELFKIRLKKLNGMGFRSEVSEVALKEYKTVQAAIDAILAGKVTALEIEDHSHIYSPEEQTIPSLSSHHQQQQQPRETQHTPIYNHSGYQIPPRMMMHQQQPQQQQQYQSSSSNSSSSNSRQGAGAQHSNGRQSNQQHKE